MRKYLRTAFIAIGSGVAAKANGYFTALLSSTPQGALLALLLAVVLSIVLVQFLDFLILELPQKSRLARRILDPRAAVEGKWTMQVENADRPSSEGHIFFNIESKEYCFYGYALAKDGKRIARWDSTYLTIDLAANEVRYLYEAHIQDGKTEDVKGTGTIKLDRDTKGKVIGGSGWFIESGSTYERSREYFERLVRAGD